MIIDNIGLHGFIQAHRRRQSILIVKFISYDCLLNRRTANPIIPNAKINSIDGSGTL
jgi:hypothetical protein